jgi:glycosyltransferase involved in cell wall biosynthesis
MSPASPSTPASAPVRILYVHHGRGIGGAPLSLLFLIRSLDRARYAPTVLCLHESEAADLFRREGIETIVLRGIRDFSHTNVLWYPWWQLPKILHRALAIPYTIERMRRFLQSRPFDLVHLNTSTLLACGIAAQRAGIPVVWHIREPLAHGYFGWRRAYVRSVIDRCATRIVPICRYDGEQLLETDRIRVVYNFVEFSRFDRTIDGTAVRRELGIPDDVRLVTMLGGINAIKGTEVFVRAALATAARRDVHYLVVGAGEARGLRALVNGTSAYHRRVYALAASAADTVHITGVRGDIPEVLAASDIVCFPSTVPHFARPAIEAMAMARPVIASDLGGPQELVAHGRTGLLVPAGDAGALAAAITDLVDDDARRTAMGEEGWRTARERFDAARNIREVVAVYEEALAEGCRQ